MKDNFNFIENDINVVITKYIGTDTHVIIPKEINGKSVTEIGVSAFSSCEQITTI